MPVNIVAQPPRVHISGYAPSKRMLDPFPGWGEVPEW